MAWLGEMDKAGRLGVERVAEGVSGYQQNLFEEGEPEWVGGVISWGPNGAN